MCIAICSHYVQNYYSLKEIVPLERVGEAGPPLELNSRYATGSHSIIVAAVEDGGSIPAPADCEVRSLIKFLNAQSIAPIEIHCQLWQQSFPADFSLLVAHNCQGEPVVQKIVRQVGAKATDTRTQSKAYGVSIDNCDPSFVTPQEISVCSASAFSEWQRGRDECQTVVPIPGGRLLRHKDTEVGPTQAQIQTGGQGARAPPVRSYGNYKI